MSNIKYTKTSVIVNILRKTKQKPRFVFISIKVYYARMYLVIIDTAQRAFTLFFLSSTYSSHVKISLIS